MIVNSTELQNNFGKYLVLAGREDIVVTRNGIPIAKLSGVGGETPSLLTENDTAREKAEAYPARRGVTYEEFLELTRTSEDRYELIDGEVYLLSSPKTTHQVALNGLIHTFYPWFRKKECSPFVAPYDITLSKGLDNICVVQPDLMIICDLEQKLGEDGYYKGVPALVVEIISETTRSRDMVKKLDLYMDCGIEEYWVVNPLNREVTVYQFKDKEIRDSKTYKNKETAESGIFPGLAVAVDTLFCNWRGSGDRSLF